MWNQDLLLQLTENVNAIDLQNYLQAMGWSKIENIPGDIAIYRRPESELDEILIPLDHKFVDYKRRIAEAVASLAEFEKHNVMDLVKTLLLPG